MTASKQHNASYLPAEFIDAPSNVKAYTTLITGGFSSGGYGEYNLASHVGDDASSVEKNRSKLIRDLMLPVAPIWLNQVHANNVISLSENNKVNSIKNNALHADASVTVGKGVVCAVMTADCLPVFFCNRFGTEVAVAHAGWRGLHTGIISNTLNMMESAVENISVYLGPAIGPKAFEVGEDVRKKFVNKDKMNGAAFVETSKNHYLCDIYALARIELKTAGVRLVSGGDFCTFTDTKRFFSYRRQQKTGRMANLIWLE